MLDPSEILVVEEPRALTDRPRAVLNWLARQAEQDDSPLEQILLLGEGGSVTLDRRSAAAPKALRLD